MGCVAVYRDAMGYSRDPEEYERTVDRWIDAVHRAWRLEARENGDRMVLADALDRAIRLSTIAIGERCGTFRVELSSTVVTVRLPGPAPKFKRVA